MRDVANAPLQTPRRRAPLGESAVRSGGRSSRLQRLPGGGAGRGQESGRQDRMALLGARGAAIRDVRPAVRQGCGGNWTWRRAPGEHACDGSPRGPRGVSHVFAPWGLPGCPWPQACSCISFLPPSHVSNASGPPAGSAASCSRPRVTIESGWPHWMLGGVGGTEHCSELAWLGQHVLLAPSSCRPDVLCRVVRFCYGSA